MSHSELNKLELNVLDSAGKKVGSKGVEAAVFAADIKKHLLHQVVRWQRAKKRAGTHSTLTRAQMSGGGRKPWKQKGTGNARAGSNTSAIWVGGGIAHGPKPRDYEFSLNKKERSLALAGALSARNQEGMLLVVSDAAFSQDKTKETVKVLKALGITKGKAKAVKVLVVVTKEDKKSLLSLRNIAGVTVISPSGLNVYDIMSNKYLVISENSLPHVEKRFSTEAN